MVRTLMLALMALGIGIFASSLLRTEKAAGEQAPAAPAHGRCSARTRSGGRCTRPAVAGSERCWQHRQ